MMIRLITLLAAALAVMPLTAAAQSMPHAAETPLGAVETQYVRVAPGLFIETRLVRAGNKAELWSDVRIRGNGDAKPRNELAKNPDHLAVVPGDVVAVSIGTTSSEHAAAPLPDTTRITHRVAPAGSALARQFEQSLRPAATLAKRFDDAGQVRFEPELQAAR